MDGLDARALRRHNFAAWVGIVVCALLLLGLAAALLELVLAA